MPKEKVPAFQFYPKDFLSDSKVEQMSNTEVGIYIRLICYCWLEGALPLETSALARMVRMPLKQFTKLWENSVVKTCFSVGEDGLLHQGRLDTEREKQEQYRRRQSDAAAMRWDKPAHTRPQPLAMPPQCSPSPSSSPISDLQTPSLSKARVSDDDLGDRARELLEAYPVWYAQERHGARLPLLGGTLQWQEAQTLCATWDDARLEKLARIVLSTDDEFLRKTDRGWKIFVLKASWADDRLRQWEQQNGVAV